MWRKEEGHAHVLDQFTDLNDPAEQERIRWDDLFGTNGTSGINDLSDDAFDSYLVTDLYV